MTAFDLQARAWLGLGQPQMARQRWSSARDAAESLGARRGLWEILFALSRLEPDPTEAERLRRQAQEVASYIAEHAPADLRASFLALPDVRALCQAP